MKRIPAIIAELAVTVTLSVLLMDEQERALHLAQALRCSAKISRRIAESCLRYAIRTEGLSSRMVRPDGT